MAMNGLEKITDKILSEAQAKADRGENCDAEQERYNELGRQEDNNYDNYRNQREEIYSSYESQIQEAEQEEEAQQDEEYGM